MTDLSPKGATFAYQAVTPDGQRISGSIDAHDSQDAIRRLQSLQLGQIQLDQPATASRAKALRGEDFAAFNQQLAQLTGAGLPVEQGLRMIAAEMRKSSMRRTLDLVAAELESGKTLPEAVAAYRDKFPPLYAQLIDAGIRAGNLSGILLNLGRHLTLVRRLQSALWQTLSYPAIVLVAFFGVIYFILVRLVPRWEPMLGGFASMNFWVRTGGTYNARTIEIPWFTSALFDVSNFVSAWPVWAVLAVVAALAVGAWAFLRMTNRDEAVSERLLLPMPLVGQVLRQNLISRWCHAVALAVEAGLDLPAAIRLADDATASPRLGADGSALIAALNAGQPLSAAATGKILPPTIIAAMEMSAARGDLPVTLRAMSQMYQQQAELCLGSIQAVLAPILLVFIGLAVGALMVAMFAPLLGLLQSLWWFAMNSGTRKLPSSPSARTMALLLAAVASLIGLVIASSVQSPALSGIFTVLSIVFFAGFVLLSIRLFRAAPPGQAMYSVGRAMWMVTSLTFWSVAVGLGILAIGYGAAVGAPGAGPILVYALAFVVIVLAGVSGAMQIVRRRRTLLILSNLEKATQLNLPLQRMILAAAQSEKGVLQARLMALHEHLDRGEPLHQALVNAVPDMPYNVVRVIAAGERMGCLPHVLGGLIRSRTSRYGPFVQTAGPYRCYLAVFIAVAWLILTVVIPKFQGIMNDFKISMPQSTRLLVAVSPESVLWAILLTLLALAPLARALEKVFPSFRTISPFGGAMGDQILWWMPVTGGFVRDRGTAELCDLVAVGVEMGHPVDESIREAAAAQPNAVMRYRTTAWADAVTRGQPLHEAARFARMPDLFVSMLATVRDSDGLLQVLGFLWRYYEYRFVRTRAILQAAYVPVIVFLMGAMVAILGLSIIQPLTSMMDHLARHVSGGF